MGALTALEIALLAALATGAGPEERAGPEEGVRTVDRDLELEAGAELHLRLAIVSSGVTIEGHGATLIGPGRAGDLSSFHGSGVKAEGVSRVTVRNLRARGFRRGLEVSRASGWRIEECDFSGNYHDPEYGWGDGERAGGLILTEVRRSVIFRTRAQRVWNGLDLRDSDENRIEENVFSHCSNVALALWHSSRNRVADNDLSWGLRIRQGEVHARDSTCVLIESGSNDNRFERNDATHGGDGIFIRVLNGWVCTGNVFVENDTSFANNNGFESWSPGNTFLANHANHSSFGFWLGGSDRTVLIGNEAAHNGEPDGFSNAPEPDFGHGGIVIVGGPGSHTRIEDNWCHHNRGGGIVLRGDLASRGALWRIEHVLVQGNRLEANRWGLFARFVDGLYLAENERRDNAEEDLLEGVTRLRRGSRDPRGLPAPAVRIAAPSRVLAGEPVALDASASRDPGDRPLRFFWSIGALEREGARIEHVFEAPGFYRVGVTATAGGRYGLAHRDLYAIEPGPEPATEGAASRWRVVVDGVETGGGSDAASRDDATERGASGQAEPSRASRPAPPRAWARDDPRALVGRSSLRLRVEPPPGGPSPRSVELRLPLRSPPGAGGPEEPAAGGKPASLRFWIAWRHEGHGLRGPQPVVVLHAPEGRIVYTPVRGGLPRELLAAPPVNEARHGWLRIEVPLAGGEGWLRREIPAEGADVHVSAETSLRFTTERLAVAARGPTGLASDGRRLWLASRDDDRLLWSEDGRHWEAVPSPAPSLGGARADWTSGLLAAVPRAGGPARLVLRFRPARERAGPPALPRLAAFDPEARTWSWTPVETILGHGSTVTGSVLWGLAHAIGGNYGGALARVDLAAPSAREQRSVPAGAAGADPAWFSRAAQLAALDGRIWLIKNDWRTPAPPPAERGDRLLSFDPAQFRASAFSGGPPFAESSWRAAATPLTDHGPLPFEPGWGAALVALPPRWCAAVGARGGLFIAAGSSPSNQEGFGAPSDRFAIYDLESGRFREGRLPGPTGRATSAALHRGELWVRRGGTGFADADRELWRARPIPPAEALEAARSQARRRVKLDRVEALGLRFGSGEAAPFSVWIDGLRGVE